jgi:hypothetical protein
MYRDGYTGTWELFDSRSARPDLLPVFRVFCYPLSLHSHGEHLPSGKTHS